MNKTILAIGAHVGETVVAQTPGGALRIKVIEIAL